MNTGFISGLLLAVLNGAICLTLPLVLAKATQKKSKHVENLGSEIAATLVESEITAQQV